MEEREIKSDIRDILYESEALQMILDILAGKQSRVIDIQDLIVQERIRRKTERTDHVQAQQGQQAKQRAS